MRAKGLNSRLQGTFDQCNPPQNFEAQFREDVLRLVFCSAQTELLFVAFVVDPGFLNLGLIFLGTMVGKQFMYVFRPPGKCCEQTL